MNETNNEKIVDYKTYCKKCKFKNCKDQDGEEPCNECLNNPVNLNSKKPIKYEELTPKTLKKSNNVEDTN